ncbi:MAG TPA: glycoside hydrolase family 2 TIM barrel-domain containing protein [Opitutaceae bacterium]
MSKHAFTLLFALLPFAPQALEAEVISSLSVREGQSLDGEWKYIVDPYELGYYDYRWQPRDESTNPSRDSFFLDVQPKDATELIEYNFETAPTLKVPGDWNTQERELLYYEGTLWYRKKFDFDGLKEGERAFLYFGAANYRADVYLNGKKLGTHFGGFTPFAYEATPHVKKGVNSVVVRVDNKRYKDAVPTLNTDWWNYGGLTRSVRLVTVPATFISEYKIRLESEETRVVSGEIQLKGAAASGAVQISIPELGQELEVKTDASGRGSFRFEAPKLKFWSPEDPKLYEVRLEQGRESVTDQVGFRTIRTKGRQILLNGKPVFLRGICIHEELAVDGGGRVTSAEQAKQLLTWAKELNCNFVRLAHYPHNETMVRLAERLGILVWSEIPVYWTIDWENEATYQRAATMLSDMIQRDYNRAAVIIWSLANETPVNEPRTRFLSRLAGQARSLDKTRLLSAAMEKHSKPGADDVQVVEDPLAEIVDIVSFNQYVGWYDGLPEKCARVKWEIPYDKPIFISEFGAGAKQGMHGDKTARFTEEYQEDLYRQTLAMLDRIDGLCGFSPWVLIDFRSPRRPLPKIQDGFNRKGLVSSEGVKKKAFFTLQEYYRKRLEAAK